jgi:hypothetical protein
MVVFLHSSNLFSAKIHHEMPVLKTDLARSLRVLQPERLKKFLPAFSPGSEQMDPIM